MFISNVIPQSVQGGEKKYFLLGGRPSVAAFFFKKIDSTNLPGVWG